MFPDFLVPIMTFAGYLVLIIAFAAVVLLLVKASVPSEFTTIVSLFTGKVFIFPDPKRVLPNQVMRTCKRHKGRLSEIKLALLLLWSTTAHQLTFSAAIDSKNLSVVNERKCYTYPISRNPNSNSTYTHPCILNRSKPKTLLRGRYQMEEIHSNA